MMGGDIGRTSETGQGSGLTASLPLNASAKLELVDSRPAEADDNDRPVSIKSSENQQSVRILLAEDTIVNQKLPERMLTNAGHEVETAENGKIAMERVQLAVIAENPDDIVLMNILIPVMDGY